MVNEDYVGHRETGGLGCWVLADGAGGHHGGEEASRLAVEAVLAEFMRAPELSTAALGRYLAAAQAALLARQAAEPVLAAMRTTLVVLLAGEGSAVWAHIGDSRLYHLRGGRICYQTTDHSVPQALVAAGELRQEEVRHHADRSRLLRAVGKDRDFRPTIVDTPLTLQAGDIFLLCSDGFWEYLLEMELATELALVSAPSDWLAALESRLLARTQGGHDNYSAVAVFTGCGCSP